MAAGGNSVSSARTFEGFFGLFLGMRQLLSLIGALANKNAGRFMAGLDPEPGLDFNSDVRLDIPFGDGYLHFFESTVKAEEV